jgi:WD40 repeat protein
MNNTVPGTLRFLLIILCLGMSLSSHAQEAAYRVRVIPLEGLAAYDVEVAPQRGLAVVYTGRIASALLGMPVVAYEVVTSLVPVRIIDTATGEEVARLVGEWDYPAAAAISPQEDHLAVLYRNGELVVWSLDDYSEETRILTLWNGGQMAFMPDGQSVLIQVNDSAQLMQWDIASGQMTQVWRPALANFGQLALADAFGRLDVTYSAFAVSAEGRLATVTPNGEITLWAGPGDAQHIVRARDEEPGQFNVRRLNFSPDAQTLAYYDQASGQTHLWDVASASERAALPFGSASVAFSVDGARAAWTTREGLWYSDTEQTTPVMIAAELPEGTRLNPSAPLWFTAAGHVVVGGLYAPEADATALMIVAFGG